MELRERKDMDKQFQWDFSHMCPTDEAWRDALKALEADAPKIEALKGTLSASKEALVSGVKTMADIMERAEVAYIYAMLHKSADGGDPLHQEMDGLAMSLIVKLSMAASFIEPEILAIPAEKLHAWMSEADMAQFRHYLQNIDRTRAHTLDAEREKLLARLGDAAQAPSDIYEMLTNVDMVLPKIVDAKGETAQLTAGNFGVYRESPVRSVREAAFEGMFGTYKKFNNTFAATYAGSVKLDCFNAGVRGYESACGAALFRNNVPVSVYDSLIEAVRAAQPTMQRYLELRRKALKLDELDVFDLYTPIVEDVDYPMPFENGKELVLKALAPLGEDYHKLLERAFSERWIDVYENKGKRSGAFSCGVYGVHPYVLLNYTDALDDAFTLAHELGHAMHSYLSDNTQTYLNHDYAIMAAEVASITNEILLTKYLLATETDKKRRAYVLNHLLESVRTTMVRQTLFAEFEKKSHEMYEAGQPLTAKALNELYLGLESEYYKGAKINELIQYEWSYIPHFYTAFYVYQYATGLASAIDIATRILTTGDAKSYLKYLSLGGSDYPIEELKVAGVDLTKPDVVAGAMELFGKTVDELAALLDEI